MANITPIISGLRMKEHSLDEYIRPIALYDKAYKEREAEIEALNEGMSQFSPYATEEGEFKDVNDALINKINREASKIGTEGFLRDRESIRNLKREYQNTSKNLQNAVNNFNLARTELDKLKAADPTMKYNYITEDGEKIGMNVGINSYMNNGKPKLVTMSGQVAENEGQKAGNAVSNRIMNNGFSISQSPIDGTFLVTNTTKSGISSNYSLNDLLYPTEEIKKKMKNDPNLANLVDDISRVREDYLNSSNYRYLGVDEMDQIDNAWETGFFNGLSYKEQSNTAVHNTPGFQAGSASANITPPVLPSVNVVETGAVKNPKADEKAVGDSNNVVKGFIKSVDNPGHIETVEETDSKGKALKEFSKNKKDLGDNSRITNARFKTLDDIFGDPRQYNSIDDLCSTAIVAIESGKYKKSEKQIKDNVSDIEIAKDIAKKYAGLTGLKDSIGSYIDDYMDAATDRINRENKARYLGGIDDYANVTLYESYQNKQSVRAFQKYFNSDQPLDEKQAKDFSQKVLQVNRDETSSWFSNDDGTHAGVYKYNSEDKTFEGLSKEETDYLSDPDKVKNVVPFMTNDGRWGYNVSYNDEDGKPASIDVITKGDLFNDKRQYQTMMAADSVQDFGKSAIESSNYIKLEDVDNSDEEMEGIIDLASALKDPEKMESIQNGLIEGNAVLSGMIRLSSDELSNAYNNKPGWSSMTTNGATILVKTIRLKDVNGMPDFIRIAYDSEGHFLTFAEMQDLTFGGNALYNSSIQYLARQKHYSNSSNISSKKTS